MLIYTLIWGLGIICFIIGEIIEHVCKNNEKAEIAAGVLWLVWVATILACLIMMITMICCIPDIDELLQEHDAIMYQLTINEDPLNNVELMARVSSYNTTITKHAANCHNIWIDLWYSENIAELPLITF